MSDDLSIAICFSGLPRTLLQPTARWQRFIDQYHADVFIHTWEDVPQSRDRLRMQMSRLFNPRSLVIETPRKFNFDLYKDSPRIWPYRSHPSNVLSMWYSIEQSIELCHSYHVSAGKHYDIVCRARFDWWCETIDLELRPGLTVPDAPTLSGHRFTYRGQPYVAHMDQFGYGSMDVMMAYAATRRLIPTLFMDCGVDFCSELLLTAAMMHQGVSVHYQPDMNFRIER